MAYLITGFPGTGKSTIASGLKKRGHKAYDPEKMKAFTHTEDRNTGKHLRPPESLPLGWYDYIGAHNWDPVKISLLLDQPGDIFICSFAHNIASFYKQFKMTFVLTLDDYSLEERLMKRAAITQGHVIGKTLEERTDIINLHRHFEQSLVNLGAIKLDATKTTQQLIDEILNYVSHSTRLA